MIRLTHFLLLLILSGIPTSVFSQAWTRISPTPQENRIRQIIRIPGTENVIAACEGSTIMRSGDLGDTWDIVINPGGQANDFNVLGIYFLDELTGFAWGYYETILKTSDGGQSWKTVFKGSDVSYYKIGDMEFINDSTGLASKTGEGFYYTTDKGETWEIIDTPDYYEIGLLEFMNDTEGVLLGISWGECNFMRTTNGGLDWVLETPAGLPLEMTEPTDLKFINDSTGFAIVYDDSGLIFKTTDKGRTWVSCYSDTYYSGDIEFLNDQQGIALLWGVDSSRVIITNDAGSTWEEVSMVVGRPVNCTYLSEGMALLGGNEGMIYRSVNDLTQWERLDEHVLPGSVLKSQFLSDSIGFIMCDLLYGMENDLRLMKTTDEGLTWDLLTSPTSDFEQGDFHFISQDTGFVVSNYNFYSTFDGGQSWNSFPTNFYTPAVAIEFFDKNNGFVCTTNTPSYTNDGGITWNNVTPVDWYSGDLHDIEYISEQEIIITSGDYSSDYTLAYKTVDGGQTWVMVLRDFKGNANQIIHSQGDTVFLACTSIFRSIDRGETWTDMQVTGMDKIRSLSFPSSTVGYAVGKDDFNTLMKTLDGGTTWNVDNLYCSSTLNDVHFFDEDYGLVFGDNGVELKTTIGGSVENKLIPVSADNYFDIYPNPVSAYLRIVITDKNLYDETQIEIFDILGKRVATHKSINGNENLINIESLKSGVYIIQLKNVGGEVLQTRKIIRQL